MKLRQSILTVLFAAPLFLVVFAALSPVVNVRTATLAINDTIPAFPGAQGYGAIALSKASPLDCRSLPLVVHKVTNLGVSGAGSLSDILQNQASNSNFDVIIFTTGGTIPSETRILLNKNCVYIAGQSAPGGGIVMSDPTYSSVTAIFRFDSDDIVLRYMRIRANSTDGLPAQSQNVTLFGERIMVDHVSTSHSDDKEFAIDQSPPNLFGEITISNSIIYAPIGSGINIHGDPGDRGGPVSIIYDYMGGRNWRFPRFEAVTNAQIVNNLIHAWTSDGIRLGSDTLSGRMNVEFIRNRMKPLGAGAIGERFGSVEFGLDPIFAKMGDPNFYVSGNIHGGVCTALPCDQTQWQYREGKSGLVPDSSFKATPTLSPRPFFDADTARWSAVEAFDSLSSITGLVGASERVNCDGTWSYNRDAIDSAFVAEARDSTALRGDSLQAWGVSLVLATGSPCTDTDGDGMPDAYEDLYTNIDKNVSDADNDTDADLWLAIEEYLNKCSAGISCSPDAATSNDGTEGSTPIAPTYGSTRFVYYDTVVQYTDGSLVRLLPDTSQYGVAVADVGFGLVFKIRVGAAEGDPVLIFADDSIVGRAASQLDSTAATDTVGVWALPGFTEDSLKNWSVP